MRTIPMSLTLWRRMKPSGVLVSCLVVLAATGAAEAQGIANSFTELRLLVRPGDTVSVTSTTGREVTGRITELSSSTLALMVGGQQRDLREAEVVTIRQRRGDSLQNGALAGLCIGGLLGGAAGASLGPEHRAQIAFWAAVMYGGLGAGLGAGVDALISTREVIYERADGQGVRLSMSLTLRPRRKAVLASVRF
jgi:hypothetical protein